MNNWKMKLYRFMQGRYGNDEFSQFLMIAGLVVLLIANFTRSGLLHTLAWIMLIYGYFRIVSRNIAKRQQENFKFLNFKAKLLKKTSGGTSGANKWQRKKAQKQNSQYNNQAQQADAENYNYYRCRNCGQVVRVPKGKGSVKITCPGCKNSFIDRT